MSLEYDVNFKCMQALDFVVLEFETKEDLGREPLKATLWNISALLLSPYAKLIRILTCSDIQHQIFVQRRQHHLKLSQSKCLEKNWSETRLIWDCRQIAG